MSNLKKNQQLGMPAGTAANRLRKLVLFSLLSKEQRACYRCGHEIESADALSIEHKEPWLDSDDPQDRFFDLNNVAFSHLSCNISAARKPQKKYSSRKEKREQERTRNAAYMRRVYTTERRRDKFLRTGY